jgi:hypothetical protein
MNMTGKSVIMPFIACAWALLSTAAGCITVRPLTSDSVFRELDSHAEEIAGKPGEINSLKGIRVGTTGYYYVLDANGRIISHPVKALIGFGFRENSLFKTMQESGRGCARQKLGDEDKLVFFVPARGIGFVCLSISAAEFMQIDAPCQNQKQ